MQNRPQYNPPMNNAKPTQSSKKTAAIKAATADLKAREAAVLNGAADVMSVDAFLALISTP
jgi:hypothetical protein